ncbi:retrovirus-related pol polyprotein from transposon TNT 1-94 [Tanacetum coccineum]
MEVDTPYQNRSIVHTRYNKTPYELIRGRKPNAHYFHVFGSLCNPSNDRDDLGKIKPKANIGIFIGYSESPRGNYVSRTSEVSNNSAVNTLDVEDTPSPSSIIVEDSDALQIVTSSEEPIIQESSTLFKEAESSSNYKDASNMHEFAIKVKWLWKNKTNAKNTVILNKSRLVAKGYSQQEGIDFEESFAPAA